ncbi:hypothetical protein HK101_006232, partial [Irineochytrium annulatum]
VEDADALAGETGRELGFGPGDVLGFEEVLVADADEQLEERTMTEEHLERWLAGVEQRRQDATVTGLDAADKDFLGGVIAHSQDAVQTPRRSTNDAHLDHVAGCRRRALRLREHPRLHEVRVVPEDAPVWRLGHEPGVVPVAEHIQGLNNAAHIDAGAVELLSLGLTEDEAQLRDDGESVVSCTVIRAELGKVEPRQRRLACAVVVTSCREEPGIVG